MALTSDRPFRKVWSTDEEEFQSTATEDRESHDESDLVDLLYPPEDVKKMEDMVQYILKNKKLPAVLPEDSPFHQWKRNIQGTSFQWKCCASTGGIVPRSDPVLITQKAKILINLRIVQGRSMLLIYLCYYNLLWWIRCSFIYYSMCCKLCCDSCWIFGFPDISTYCQSCPQCGTLLRYQAWKDALHNFDDQIILALSLCLTVRNMLQVMFDMP